MKLYEIGQKLEVFKGRKKKLTQEELCKYLWNKQSNLGKVEKVNLEIQVLKTLDWF